jgi:hypothetical protein
MATAPEFLPPELCLDTSDAQALASADALLHLEELLGLRDWLARLQRDLHRTQSVAEQADQAARTRLMKLAVTAVAIVDELRQLVAEARRVVRPAAELLPRAPLVTPLASDFPAVPRGGLWARLFGRRGPGEVSGPTAAICATGAPTPLADDWLIAIERHVASAVQQLETREVYYIALHGQDLREIEFEGQSLKPWVAIKNRPTSERLLVIEELRGLWVGRLEGRVVPIQRGEVRVEDH